MFGLPIICYLFLGGIGGGTCMVLSAISLMVPREKFALGFSQTYRSVFKSGYIMSALMLIIAALCLLSDVGNSGSLPRLFLSGKISYLSVGAYLIAVGIFVSLVLAFLWGTRLFIKRIVGFGILQVSALVLGFLIALYTGLFLASMRAVPLWNTFWLPPLFLFSSISCGLVSVSLIIQATSVEDQFKRSLRHLAFGGMLMLLLEAVCMIGLILNSMLAGDANPTLEAAAFSVTALISGDYSWVFWVGFVAVGLLVVSILESISIKCGRTLLQGSCFALALLLCVYVGAFAMRFCIVSAGIHPVMSIFGA